MLGRINHSKCSLTTTAQEVCLTPKLGHLSILLLSTKGQCFAILACVYKTDRNALLTSQCFLLLVLHRRLPDNGMQLHPCTIPDIQGGSIPRHNLPNLARCRVESKANGVFLLIFPRTVYMTTALPIPVSCILLPCSLKLSPLIDHQPVHTQYETRPRAASVTQGSLPDLCPSIHDLNYYIIRHTTFRYNGYD